jgi:hypothetical protein
MLYVWIISAVFLSCIIGVSQSELAIPRILDRLQHDLEQRVEKDGVREMQQRSKTRPFSETYTICDTRICRGGIYSWHPDKWHKQPMRSISTLNAHPSFNDTLALHLVSMFLVTCTFLVSSFTSALVPPEGFNCRHIAQMITLALWLVPSSRITTFPLPKLPHLDPHPACIKHSSALLSSKTLSLLLPA